MQSGVCAVAYSGYATITVYPAFSAGTISNTGQTICNNRVPTTTIGSTTPAGGGDGFISYEWQYSTDITFATGVTTVASNTTTYKPTQTLTQTTYYQRLANDGTCNTTFTASTGVWTVTVLAPIASHIEDASNNILDGSTQYYCNGQSPGLLHASVTGGLPGTTYDWQIQNPVTLAFSNVTNGSPSSPSYQPLATLGTNTYRCIITNSCGVFSPQVIVVVNPRPTAFISGTTTICNGQSTDLSITFTGTAPFVYSINNSTAVTASSNPEIVSVSPSANTTYTVTSLTDANCAAQAGDMTGSAVITVNYAPSISVQPVDQTVTYGASASFSVSATATSGAYLSMAGKYRQWRNI